MSEKNSIVGFELYSDNRVLTPIEYANLKSKQNGYIPANFFRSHLFNSTNKQSKELKRKKVIYDDGKTVIKVNRSLHQRHRDLLSILFTENKGVSKPDPTGRYFIYVNLYDVAKKMGYKSPKNSRINIKQFLDNLRATDIEIIQGDIIGNCSLLGQSVLNRETGFYVVEVPAPTAKYHVLSYAVLIDPIINRQIIKISLSRLKALTSYLVSNIPIKNGISFKNICEKLDIMQPPRRTEFRKEVLANLLLLDQFSISFDLEKDIFYYTGIDLIKFQRAIKPEEIKKSLFDFAPIDLDYYRGKKGLDPNNNIFKIKEVVFDHHSDSYKMFVDCANCVDDKFARLFIDDFKLLDSYIARFNSAVL